MRMLGTALAVILSVGAVVVSAGQAVPAQPAVQTPVTPASTQEALPVPAPAPALGRVFGADAGLILSTVRPDKVVDFETVLARMHEALASSVDPVRRQQAAGWKAFRAIEPGPNGSVLYVFAIDPAVAGADYTVSRLLSEAFPDEVVELFRLYNGAVVGQNLLNLELLRAFGDAVPVTVAPLKTDGGAAAPVAPTDGR